MINLTVSQVLKFCSSWRKHNVDLILERCTCTWWMALLWIAQLNGELILTFWSCNPDSWGWLCDQSGSNFTNNKQIFRFWHFFQTLGTAQTIIGAARRKVILQRFPTARKTSINPKCLNLVPPAFRADVYRTKLTRKQCTLHSTQSWGHNGACRKHARTDEYSSLQKKKQWILSKPRTD